MSRQIAVRLPDDIVDFIDQLVASGQASSRGTILGLSTDGRTADAIRAAFDLA